MITYYLVKWKGAAETEASWEKPFTLWQFEKEVKAFEDTLPKRTSASSGRDGFLGALLITDNGMRNVVAWVALGQSLDFMLSQHTYGSLC